MPRQKPNVPVVPPMPTDGGAASTPTDSAAPTPAPFTPRLDPISPIALGANGALPNIQAASFFPENWWSPSTKIPVLDAGTYAAMMETIKGQQRAVGVLQQNLILGKEMLKAEGLSVDMHIEHTNNDIKRQNLTTMGVKLQQAGVRTQIEQTKLQSLHQDLRGNQAQYQLQGEQWLTKLQTLGANISQQQLQLEAKVAAIRQEFPTYTPKPIPFQRSAEAISAA